VRYGHHYLAADRTGVVVDQPSLETFDIEATVVARSGGRFSA
jgi:hypothetical protein